MIFPVKTHNPYASPGIIMWVLQKGRSKGMANKQPFSTTRNGVPWQQAECGGTLTLRFQLVAKYEAVRGKLITFHCNIVHRLFTISEHEFLLKIRLLIVIWKCSAHGHKSYSDKGQETRVEEKKQQDLLSPNVLRSFQPTAKEGGFLCERY